MHASQAFFVAFLDFVIFGASLKPSQILGMLTILVCVVFISLSSGSTEVDSNIMPEDKKLSVVVPILFSFTVPVAQAANIMIVKKVTTELNVKPRDFSFACYFLLSSVS